MAIEAIKPGYKKTEVGVIPEDWEVKQFSEVSFMKGRIGWQGLKQSEFTMNSDEPFLITGMNFKDGEIRWDEVYHVSFERYEIAKEIQLKEKDVLMTKDGTIGKLLYVSNIPYPGKATLNSHLLVFRPIKKSYVPKYLYYNLSSRYFKNHIEISKYGTTFFGISQEAVGEYGLLIPPYEEQEAIAKAITETDELIQQLDRLISKRKHIKKGAMQELLTGNRRLHGFSGEWEYKKVNDFAQSTAGGTPSTAIAKYWGGNIRWMSSGELNFKRIFDVGGRITEEGLRNSSAKLLPPKSVLIGLAGQGKTRGTVAISYVELSTNQSIASIYPNGSYDSEYLYQYLDSKYDELRNLSSGEGGRGGLNLALIRNLEISMPKEKQEQAAIANVLSEMDAEIEELEQKRDKYKMIKEGMMQQLLTGSIRLKCKK